MKTQSLIAVITLTVLSTSPAFAGWRAVDGEGATTLMSDGKLKHVSPEDGMSTIIDSEAGTLTMVNDRDKVYVAGKPEDFCNSMKEMMDAAMAQVSPEHKDMMEQMMENAMAEASPEQKAMMEQFTNDVATPAKPSVSVKKAGSGGKVAGWGTEKYTIMVDGDLYEEVWLVTDSALMKEVEKMDFSIFQKFSSCTEGQHGGGQDPEEAPEYMELMKKGLEVRSVSHGDVQQYSSDTVSLEEKDIPQSEFKVPAGYREVSMMEIFSMARED